MKRWIGLLALILLGLGAVPAWSHFNMLLPQGFSAKRGETVVLTYEWGHAFEHHLFDAPQPECVLVVAPDGKSIDLTKSLEKINLPGPEGKEVFACRLRFTPEQRGDYTFFLRTPPIWIEGEGEFLQDLVKVVLHVQAQKGWDAVLPGTFQLVPLTRPYGLQPGMVFQAQAEGTDRPLKGAPVEVERYHPVPPKETPADEHVTRTARTDPNGVVTCTLTEPGWWGITVQRDAGTRERKGKAYPMRQRATLWVFVETK